jgi:hypothetical protein
LGPVFVEQVGRDLIDLNDDEQLGSTRRKRLRLRGGLSAGCGGECGGD